MFIVINTEKKCLLFGRTLLSLTGKEFSLLYFLLTHPKNETIDAERVISHVWGERYRGITLTNLSQLTYLLRKKCKEKKLSVTISYSRKKGIQFSLEKKPHLIHASGKLFYLIYWLSH